MVIKIIGSSGVRHPEPGTYQFNCPGCDAVLEADNTDLAQIDDQYRYRCPRCDEKRYIGASLTRKIK